MNRRIANLLIAAAFIAGAAGTPAQEEEKTWETPKMVEPGGRGNFVEPPEDAVRLFVRSRDLKNWTKPNGEPIEWTDEKRRNVLQCEPGTGSIQSVELFQDAQIHIEFATPYMPTQRGQGRGNSGIYLQGQYEIQVLDSFYRATYVIGQCGALYNQKPPDVNASRPPGQWQSYDIIFHGAKWDDAGNRTEAPTVTVIHNGILIHENVAIDGRTGSDEPDVPGPGPIVLQDHGNKVKFRNIWLRHLDPR